MTRPTEEGPQPDSSKSQDNHRPQRLGRTGNRSNRGTSRCGGPRRLPRPPCRPSRNWRSSFHTKHKEPVRSGLNRRTAHVILLENPQGLCAVDPRHAQPDGRSLSRRKDNPGANAEFRTSSREGPGPSTTVHFSTICLEDNPLENGDNRSHSHRRGVHVLHATGEAEAVRPVDDRLRQQPPESGRGRLAQES